MPATTLRARTLRGLKWTAIENGALGGVQLLVGLILARLLDPADFGLVSMVSVLIAVLRTILDSGFSSALVQKKDLSHVDECSVFYFNIALGGILTIVLVGAAPAIASFYRQPQLTLLMRVLAGTLMIRSFVIVQRSLLTKQLDFTSQAKAAVVASLGSATVGVSLAMAGFGVWALVAQQVTSDSLRCSMYWVISPWRPAGRFSITSLKTLFGFGSRMMLSSVLDSMYSNIHAMAIGRAYSASELGLYTRGRDFALAPGHIISMVLNRVAFPAMAEIQDEPDRLLRGVRKALRALAFFSLPAMVGLALVARPFVSLLLTDRWLPMVPILQILCIPGALYPLHAIHLSLLKAVGRSDLYLRFEIVKKLLAVTSLIAMLPFGLNAVVIGQAALSIIAYLLNSSFSATVLGYTYRQQFCDVLPVLANCSVMGVATVLVTLLPINSLAIMFGVQLAIGMTAYSLIAWTSKSPEFAELVGVSRRLVANLRAVG